MDSAQGSDIILIRWLKNVCVAFVAGELEERSKDCLIRRSTRPSTLLLSLYLLLTRPLITCLCSHSRSVPHLTLFVGALPMCWSPFLGAVSFHSSEIPLASEFPYLY